MVLLLLRKSRWINGYCYKSLTTRTLLRSLSSAIPPPPSDTSTPLKDLFLAALSSQPHVTRNVDQRALSIMDNPAVNLKHPYVNRPLVTQWADEIAGAGRQSTGLYGTLAGRGKGKTRFFVELAQELNQRDGVVAVAITFGHKWHRVQPFDPTHAGMSLAVEVVLRMLAMTYRVADVDGFRKTFTTSLRRLMRHQNVFDNQLLHECIEFIIADARRGSQATDGSGGGSGCKRFVLLIDEPMRLFASGRIDVDRFNDLCYMLLAQGNVSPDVSVRLAVTTSSADLFHATDGDGDRFSVTEMPLPTQLNIDETFTRWLPAHLPQLRTGRPIDNDGDGDGDGDGGSTERHLKRLLTLTSPLPRATQLLVETLAELFPPERPRVSLTTRLVRRVQRRLLQRLDRSYAGAAEGGAVILLNDDHLVYSLLWHQPLPLHGNVARAMVDGYIVNRPTHRGGGGSGRGGGSGSGSNGTPPMLSALSLCRMAPYVNATTTLLKPVVEAAAHIVASTDAAAASNGLEANALARLANAMLTCRILSAERINLGAFSLWDLLLGSSSVIGGQRLSSVSPPPLLTVTRKRRTLDEYYHDVPLPLPLPHVAGSSSAYVQQLATCRLLDRDVVVVDTVVDNDNDNDDDDETRWHGLWLLRQGTSGQPFVLVVAYEFHDAVTVNETTTSRGSGSHVAYFRDHVVSACQAAVAGTATGGGYSDDDDNDTAVTAIAAGRFVYVAIDMRPSTGGAGPAAAAAAEAAGGEGDVEDDVGVGGDGDPHYVRLTGSAVRKVLTEAGVQVLDLARLAASPSSIATAAAAVTVATAAVPPPSQ